MPTEKDVKYYEELVQREVADKTISRGLMVKDGKGIKIVSLVFTAGGRKDKVDPKWKEEYFVEFCGWSGDCSVNYVEETMEILGHEVMIGDFLDYMEKKYDGLTIYYDQNLLTDDCAYILATRKDKRLSYSALPDDTKIALGKLVESVISPKE